MTAVDIVGVALESAGFKTAAVDSLDEMLVRTARKSIQDAGAMPKTIDGIVVPSMGAPVELLQPRLGLGELSFSASVDMGGASSVAALGVAKAAIQAGLCSRVLICCGWLGYSKTRPKNTDARAFRLPFGDVAEAMYFPFGAVSPVNWYSLVASHYEALHGDISGATAAVAVSTRRHAALNPSAALRDRDLSLSDYLSSPMVSSPYRAADCCLESDTAAAIIVQGTELHSNTPRVRIESAQQSRPVPVDDFVSRRDLLEIGLTSAVQRALAEASVSPEDFDFGQIYDCFSFEVVHQLEALGMCGSLGIVSWLEKTDIGPGGSFPVNTDGGLLACSHYLGMGHIVEAVRQLRGTAGSRQVPKARLGVVTGWGDLGDGSIAILSAPGFHGRGSGSV